MEGTFCFRSISREYQQSLTLVIRLDDRQLLERYSMRSFLGFHRPHNYVVHMALKE